MLTFLISTFFFCHIFFAGPKQWGKFKSYSKNPISIKPWPFYEHPVKFGRKEKCSVTWKSGPTKNCSSCVNSSTPIYRVSQQLLYCLFLKILCLTFTSNSRSTFIRKYRSENEGRRAVFCHKRASAQMSFSLRQKCHYSFKN